MTHDLEASLVGPLRLAHPTQCRQHAEPVQALWVDYGQRNARRERAVAGIADSTDYLHPPDTGDR